MKNTFKSLFAIAAIGTSSIASAALIPSSGTVSMQNTSFDGVVNVGGGEFKATIDGFDSFYTFCVEFNENIALPGIYDYTITDEVDSQGDLLSQGTVYLYEAFLRGNLYARTLDGAHDLAAGQLQTAIWLLEDEVGFKQDYVAGNPFINLVVSAFGSLASAKLDDTTGHVKVMNLKADGQNYQDVLVYVPDSGATLALLGLGLTGLAIVGRRRS